MLSNLQGCHLIFQRYQKSKKWQTPKSVQEVQQFLGLANYYRCFIKNFATIPKPLHRTTERKKPFKWTAQCQQALNQLKNCQTTSPILAKQDWTRPYIIDTDACETGIGVVLFPCDPDGTEHVIPYAICASCLLTKPRGSTALHTKSC